MITVNAIGKVCPKPVILTKKELDKIDEGDVETLVDDIVCVKNLEKYAKGQGFNFSYIELDDGNYKTLIHKNAIQEQENVVLPIREEKLTIAISSDSMGQGDEVLGKILMKSFIYTVSETDPLPNTLLFYNSGVRLTTEGSEVVDDLIRLKEKGVEIMSCGTCLDFYQLKDKFLVGEISNMYTIYERLAEPVKCVMIG